MISSPLRRILTGFALALALPAAAQEAAPPAPLPPPPRWSLAIHGGAGTITREATTPEKEAEYRAALERALARVEPERLVQA